jgi:hypothetical protein
MYRASNEKPTAEVWHRDETPNADASDVIFGGWIHGDPQDQIFSCIPGSHLLESGDANQLPSGFIQVCKPKDKKRKAELKQQSIQVVVPAGCLLLFIQNIVHEVVSSVRRYIVTRVFTGYRLTRSAQGLISNMIDLLQQQAVIPLKSQQLPPMYPKLWWVNHSERLESWSRALVKQEIHTQRERKGVPIESCPRFMESLTDYKLPLYSPYSSDELKLYTPQLVPAISEVVTMEE